jgi:hypothetical protein
VKKKGKLIAYRTSMFKYESKLTQLEVLGVSRPRGPARLNIQFILLLLTLGVKPEVWPSELLFMPVMTLSPRVSKRFSKSN